MRWVLASRNEKKVDELRTILAGAGVTLESLAAFPDAPEVEETGTTFEANARLKAEAARDATGLAALADDSGLAVDALDGAPGVHSARFAGPFPPDADRRTIDRLNNEALLARLADTAEAARGAAFHCVVALAVPGEETRTFAGTTRGRILAAPRGAGGFGYDPLFLSDDLGVTFAEAPADAKHAASHRGRALAALRQWVEKRQARIPPRSAPSHEGKGTTAG